MRRPGCRIPPAVSGSVPQPRSPTGNHRAVVALTLIFRPQGLCGSHETVHGFLLASGGTVPGNNNNVLVNSPGNRGCLLPGGAGRLAVDRCPPRRPVLVTIFLTWINDA